MTTRKSQLDFKNVVLITILVLSLAQNIITYRKIGELQRQVEAQTIIINSYSSTITSLENDVVELNNQIDTLTGYLEYLEEELSYYRSREIQSS